MSPRPAMLFAQLQEAFEKQHAAYAEMASPESRRAPSPRGGSSGQRGGQQVEEVKSQALVLLLGAVIGAGVTLAFALR